MLSSWRRQSKDSQHVARCLLISYLSIYLMIFGSNRDFFWWVIGPVFLLGFGGSAAYYVLIKGVRWDHG